MARHRARRGPTARMWALVTLVVVGLVAGAVVIVARARMVAPAAAGAAGCPAVLRVVTSASFAPVLEAVKPALAADPECVRLDVLVAEGRSAAARAVEV